jgi:transcriptional regulator with XRE-family HTH domain
MRLLDPGQSPLHFFGAEVRRAREAAGMTLADLAATVPCDASTVSRIESGLLSPTERFAVACDEAFPHMAGWFMRFCADSRTWAVAHPPWFRDWIEIEQRATVIRSWQPLLVPGLLQTPEYARAVLGWGPDDGPDLEERVAARMERQAIFDREIPPEVWILLHEAVLNYSVGAPDVMGKQAGLRTKSYPLFRWYLGEADGIGAAGVPVPSTGAAEFAGPGF